jgi:hypothetical protein
MPFKRLARIMLLTFLLTFGFTWLALEVWPNEQTLIQRCRDQMPPSTMCGDWEFETITFNSLHTEAHAQFSDGINGYDCDIALAGLRWEVKSGIGSTVGCLSP